MNGRTDVAKADLIINDSQLSIDYSRGLGRRNSQVSLTNRANKETITLSSLSFLGEGSYGYVRKFGYGNINVAVKKLHEQTLGFKTRYERTEHIKELEKEFDFLKRCYPRESPYALFVWNRESQNLDSTHPYKIDCRIVMPLIQGIKLKTWLRAATDIDMIALVIYNIAVELKRFHDLGILHGDVSTRNIMVATDLSVHFIDFSFAYNHTDKATTFEQDPKKATYIAPERLNLKQGTSVAANYAQDVFSLAHSMECLINHYVTLTDQLALYKKFPMIERFIANGLQVLPENRPSLQSLIADLSPLLIMPSIKLAVTVLEDETITELLRSKVDSINATKMNQLLLDICLHKNFKKARVIIDFLRKEIPTYQNDQLLDQCKIIIDLRKKVQKLHIGIFQDDERSALIEQLATAFKVAESLIPQPNTQLASMTPGTIHRSPRFFNLRLSESGDGPINMSISSDEMSVTKSDKI